MERKTKLKQLKESIIFIVKMSFALAYLVVLLSFIISFLLVHTISLMSWVNTVLIISLLILVVGCILIMIQGGFWDWFNIYFKRFWQKKAQAEGDVRDKEVKCSKDVSKSMKEKSIHASTKVMTVSGGFLVALSIFLSYSFK